MNAPKRVDINGWSVVVVPSGAIKADGVVIGRWRERGVGRFVATLETGEDLGTFRTRMGAVTAVVEKAERFQTIG